MSEFNTRVGRIRVEYWPEWKWGEFIVVFGDVEDHTQYITFWESGWAKTAFNSPSVVSPLPPPSETLLSLLRHFHTHRAVAPLLDRLLEEYPQLEEWVNPAELLEPVTTSEGVA